MGARDTDRRWRFHSLAWWLPAAISVLVAAVLSVVVWAAYREVDRTLSNAASERSRATAGQVANLFEGLMRPMVARVRLAGTEPALRAFLADPSSANRAAADAVIAQINTGSTARHIALWDAAGARVISVAEPGRADNDGPASVPESTTVPDEGLSPLVATEGGAYLDLVAVVSDVFPRLDRMGALSLRIALSINPPGLIGQLVGQDAIIKLGNRDGSVWVDLKDLSVAPPPPIDLTSVGPARYDGAGGPHLGALAEIRDTPWLAWVEFPRETVVAPARQFLRRMLWFGALAALLVALLVRFVTARVTAPLARMTDATEAIAAGDYSRRVDTGRRDEIGRLGRAFDRMAEHVAQDITHRETVAHVLQENEDRMRFTLRAARVGTWQMDMESLEVTFSETMAPLFGLETTKLPLARDGVLALIHPDDQAVVAGCMERGAVDRTEHEIRFRAMQPDGSYKWALGRSRLLADASGALRILGVCFDISEQRLLEEQLRQSQKMEAIGQLAGGIAHDFNNLLTAILGFGNFVLEDLGPDDPRRGHVEEILKAGHRAADLTAQLLAFSRKQLLQPTVVDVNVTVTESMKLLGRLIGEHIQMETVLTDGIGRVRADPVQLQQIVMNLAINARDAMPEGGRLTIETANIELDQSYGTQHYAVTPGSYVMLAVTDTVVGMSDEVRGRMFEPFFTTKARGQGTGLGLATVYGAVKQAGGYIWVYSEPGRGSTFKVYLPRLPADATAEAVLASPAPAVAGSELLLLVEDEEAVRTLTRMILTRIGYRVIEAANSDEAEARHREASGGVALLVTDVVLPGSSGPELFQRLAARDPQLKVLYMSGYTDDAVFRTGRLQRGVAFVQKPFTAAGIRKKVREVLDA